MQYLELKAKHEKELNEFPMMFAFNDKQFAEGLKKLGADKSEIAGTGGGGFIRKTDKEALKEMFNRHNNEMKEAMKNAEFAFNMFDYELCNHEYCITCDDYSTISALGLTYDGIENNPILKEALKKAKLNTKWED